MPFFSQLKRKSRGTSQGFTLIEMILVIVLLGILSVGISGFIKFGTQIYVDVTDRDELVASARYAVERLNRELRFALPNSVRTKQVNTDFCIEFYPILTSAIYADIPVPPESARTTITFAYNDVFPNTGKTMKAVVYPLTADELYGNSDRIHAITGSNANTNNIWEMTFPNAIRFKEHSPTKRIFVVNTPVSYCVNTNGQLKRFEVNEFNEYGVGILMAENIILAAGDLPFKVNNASLYRNSSILIKLMFSKNNELITFNNEVQVRNVP